MLQFIARLHAAVYLMALYYALEFRVNGFPFCFILASTKKRLNGYFYYFSQVTGSILAVNFDFLASYERNSLEITRYSVECATKQQLSF